MNLLPINHRISLENIAFSDVFILLSQTAQIGKLKFG